MKISLQQSVNAIPNFISGIVLLRQLVQSLRWIMFLNRVNTVGGACDSSSWQRLVWTSGQRRNMNCSYPFVWKPDSSTVIDLQYEGWSRVYSQPDCLGSNEFCLLMLGTDDFNWHDDICTSIYCVLCEFGPF